MILEFGAGLVLFCYAYGWEIVLRIFTLQSLITTRLQHPSIPFCEHLFLSTLTIPVSLEGVEPLEEVEGLGGEVRWGSLLKLGPNLFQTELPLAPEGLGIILTLEVLDQLNVALLTGNSGREWVECDQIQLIFLFAFLLHSLEPVWGST